MGVVLRAGDLRVAGETVVLALRGSAECWRFSYGGRWGELDRLAWRCVWGTAGFGGGGGKRGERRTYLDLTDAFREFALAFGVFGREEIGVCAGDVDVFELADYVVVVVHVVDVGVVVVVVFVAVHGAVGVFCAGAGAGFRVRVMDAWRTGRVVAEGGKAEDAAGLEWGEVSEVRLHGAAFGGWTGGLLVGFGGG